MIEYSNTTVFNTDAQTIVNTVNCHGIMGSGVALEFKLRYPEMFEDYAHRCERKEVEIGRPRLYRQYKHVWILNFPTKRDWKQRSEIPWIQQGLEYFVDNYERAEITSIAFPQLGCGRGGLEWVNVQPVMEEYLAHLAIPVYICLDKDPHAQGIEKEMVDLLNQQTKQSIQDELQLRSPIANAVVSHLPIKRFRELSQFKGVGKDSYEQIFRSLYTQVNANPGHMHPNVSAGTEQNAEQMSMF